MQLICQRQYLAALSLGQLRHRDPGPAGDDSGNLFLRHTLVYQRQILFLHSIFLDGQLLLQFRQFTILQLRCPVQVILLLRQFNFFIHGLNLFPQTGQLLYRMFLVVPLGLFRVKFIPQFCQFFLQRCQTLLAGLIRLLL